MPQFLGPVLGGNTGQLFIFEAYIDLVFLIQIGHRLGFCYVAITECILEVTNKTHLNLFSEFFNHDMEQYL